MAEDPLSAALDALWSKNRERILARAGDVLRELDAAAGDRPADLALAAREAHVLAGALGTYGRAGSAIFTAVEQALAAPGSAVPEAADLGELASQVREVVATL